MGVPEKRLFPEGMGFAIIVRRARAEAQTRSARRRRVGEGGRSGREGGLGVGVFRGGGVVGTAT